MMTVLEGVVMELQDCALPLLAGMCICSQSCTSTLAKQIPGRPYLWYLV